MSIKALEVITKLFEKAEQDKSEFPTDPYFQIRAQVFYECKKAIEKANDEELEAIAALEAASERLEGTLNNPDFNSKTPKDFLKSMIGE